MTSYNSQIGEIIVHFGLVFNKNFSFCYKNISVVSWGLKCGTNVPGVYADLTRPEANNWVVDNVKILQQTRTGSQVEILVKNEVSASAWG